MNFFDKLCFLRWNWKFGSKLSRTMLLVIAWCVLFGNASYAEEDQAAIRKLALLQAKVTHAQRLYRAEKFDEARTSFSQAQAIFAEVKGMNVSRPLRLNISKLNRAMIAFGTELKNAGRDNPTSKPEARPVTPDIESAAAKRAKYGSPVGTIKLKEFDDLPGAAIKPARKIVLGDLPTGAGELDGNGVHLVIDKTKIFKNTTGQSIWVEFDRMIFFPQRSGGVVTPLILKVESLSNNQFRIARVGGSFFPNWYHTHPNLTFKPGTALEVGFDMDDAATQFNAVLLKPGESVVFGFLDRLPDGRPLTIQADNALADIEQKAGKVGTSFLDRDAGGDGPTIPYVNSAQSKVWVASAVNPIKVKRGDVVNGSTVKGELYSRKYQFQVKLNVYLASEVEKAQRNPKAPNLVVPRWHTVQPKPEKPGDPPFDFDFKYGFDETGNYIVFEVALHDHFDRSFYGPVAWFYTGQGRGVAVIGFTQDPDVPLANESVWDYLGIRVRSNRLQFLNIGPNDGLIARHGVERWDGSGRTGWLFDLRSSRWTTGGGGKHFLDDRSHDWRLASVRRDDEREANVLTIYRRRDTKDPEDTPLNPGSVNFWMIQTLYRHFWRRIGVAFPYPYGMQSGFTNTSAVGQPLVAPPGVNLTRIEPVLSKPGIPEYKFPTPGAAHREFRKRPSVVIRPNGSKQTYRPRGLQPGSVVGITSGPSSLIIFEGLRGKEDSPIIIVNSGGEVSRQTVRLVNCQHVRITGTGDPRHFYGFANSTVEIDDGSGSIEIDHMRLNAVDATKDGLGNGTLRIHHNRFFHGRIAIGENVRGNLDRVVDKDNAITISDNAFFFTNTAIDIAGRSGTHRIERNYFEDGCFGMHPMKSMATLELREGGNFIVNRNLFVNHWHVVVKILKANGWIANNIFDGNQHGAIETNKATKPVPVLHNTFVNMGYDLGNSKAIKQGFKPFGRNATYLNNIHVAWNADRIDGAMPGSGNLVSLDPKRWVDGVTTISEERNYFIRSLYKSPMDNFPSEFPYRSDLPWPKAPATMKGVPLTGLSLPNGLDLDYFGNQRDLKNPVVGALRDKP